VARLLAYVTGMVNNQLLLQNGYLLAENGILRAHLPNRLLLKDAERSTLAVLGRRLGRQELEPVASAANPDTILAGFANSSHRSSMAPATAFIQVDRPSDLTSPNSSSAWLVRIATGGTIASPMHCTIWAIVSPTKPWVTSYAAMVLLLLPSVATR
jgi:hypothetical protein